MLVKWYGDVIATRTLEAGQEVDRSIEHAGSGVSVDVVEVPYTRSSLGVAPPTEVLPVVTVLASVGAHMLMALLFAATAASPAEEAREREAALRAYRVRAEALDPEGDRPDRDRQTWNGYSDGDSALDGPTADLGFVHPHSAPLPPTTASAHPQPASPALPSAVALCTHPPSPAATGPICTRTVVVTSLARSSPSCFTDTVIEDGQRGTLSFPCQGDGPVSVRFGGAVFTGSQVGGKLEACDGTEFPWSDGCSWTSAQRVAGHVGDRVLSFTYGEAPKAGQHSCASACSATGTVAVEGG